MKSLKGIYFYNAGRLATELRDGSVSENRAIKHLIATIILGGVGFEVPISVALHDYPSGFGRVALYAFVFVLAGIISYYGVWLTYQANIKGDGKEYFLRFSALTLPIGIQLLILFLGLGLVLVLFAVLLTTTLGEMGSYLTLIASYAVGLLFTAMFFLRMRKYIGVASGADV